MDGTVLVADDDRTIRTVLTQALTRAGCRVHNFKPYNFNEMLQRAREIQLH